MKEYVKALNEGKPYCIVHDSSKCVTVKWRYEAVNTIAYMCSATGITWHRKY
jgi:hypothetical protein